ncbi:8516_t:CDS:2, partial [Funneliformis geosporum]
IAMKKPTFKDLICDRQRVCIAFSAMAVTQDTYKYCILGDLEEIFGFKESRFIIDSILKILNPFLFDNTGVNVKNHGGEAKNNEFIHTYQNSGKKIKIHYEQDSIFLEVKEKAEINGNIMKLCKSIKFCK